MMILIIAHPMMKIYLMKIYYPSSAGEDINIFILDNGFNFNYTEFSNGTTKDKKMNVSHIVLVQ